MYTLVKSCITNEDSTYTRQVNALRTRTPHTLVYSITNEDSTYTCEVIHYERGLHVHTRQVILYERGLHTLVRSYITNEDSTRLH